MSAHVKTAKPLTMLGREHIKAKNFAIPQGMGPGGTGKYPIHDLTHARAALQMVARSGTSEEKSLVHGAVAKKYPALAERNKEASDTSFLGPEDIPEYTMAVGATGGTLLGQRLKGRRPNIAGQVGGAVLGTGLGLIGGKAMSRMAKNRTMSKEAWQVTALEMAKMASVDMYVDKSEDMDRGMFAERDFAPGEVLEIAPVLVVPRKQIRNTDVLRNYVFNFDKDNVMVALGYASMFNHSYTPNARYKKDKGSRTLTFTAIKPIKEGEEIFVNYNLDPNKKDPLWFDVKEKQTEKTAAKKRTWGAMRRALEEMA